MRIAPLLLIAVLLLAACVPIPAAPTAATAIPSPSTPEPTRPPTQALEPMATPPQAEAPDDCTREATVAAAREQMPYDEFVVSYSNYVSLGIEPSLEIWYVDPELDPGATGDQIHVNAELALLNAATLARQLARSEAGPCIEELFPNGINTIVVDREYNGWYAGLIDPTAVAAVDDLAAADEDTIAGFANTQYWRDGPTTPLGEPGQDACTWLELQDRIATHLPADQTNAYSYLVRDEDGATVYTALPVSGPFGYTSALKESLAAVGNILDEIGCLNPPADLLIVLALDATGDLQLLGQLPGDAISNGDITQFEILYPSDATSEPTPAPAEPAITFSPTITGEAALHLGWTWPQKEPMLLPWVSVDGAGMSYVADQEGVLHAVVAPGEALWSVVSVCGNALPPVLSADGAALYFVGYTEEEEMSVCAVTLDGRPLWSIPVEGPAQSVPTVAPDGSLHLSTETGVLRITPDGEATEHALPEEATGSAIRSDTWPTVDGAGNSYYVNTLNSEVVVVSPEYVTRAVCPVGRGPAGVIGALRSDEDTSSSESESPTVVNVWVSDPVARAGEGFVVAADPGVIAAYDADCNELWRYTAFESEEPGDRLVVAAGPDAAIYAGGPGGLLLKLTADGELAWRQERVEGAPLIGYLAVGADGGITGLVDNPTTLLAYTADGEPTLAQPLYEIDATSLPAPMPGGGVAQIHQGALEVYTSDPTLVVKSAAPAPPPTDRAAAEAEIADFMVDLIVNEDIEATFQYIEESGWEGGPGPTENLIVWTTLAPEQAGEADVLAQTGIPKLDEENPIRVWTYNADGLAEVEGDTATKLAAITAYEENYVTMDEGPDIFAWGAYDFAITSVDESLQKAEVYRAASCGRLCGSGYLLTLERKPDGTWFVSNAEHLWQS